MKHSPSPREYVESHWSDIMSDLSLLVSIPSVADPEHAAPDAPFGANARAALDAMANLIRKKGLQATIDSGYVALCDVPGQDDQQLGVIGHLDVVPAGPGWNTDPFSLVERDGWLLGRGVIDDKGPVLAAFWALSYWCDAYDVAHGGRLPHPVRYIFGSDEEIGCSDVKHYRSHNDDPAFLFTPDADFPVCYGEKGMFGATISSKSIPLQSRNIIELSAGTAANAVPGEAYAILEHDGVRKRVEFHGVSAHASLPDKGESALKKLLCHLLEKEELSPSERRYLEAASLVAQDFHGESLGMAAYDADFGHLTGVAGVLSLTEDRFTLTYDVRFPSSVTGEVLERRLSAALEPWKGDASFAVTRNVEPFLMNADSAPVRALVEAYCEVTGLDAKPFTMGGATYARAFTSACSFGMDDPALKKPEWVGGMHAPNEGVSIEHMKRSIEIYIEAFAKLFDVDLK